MLGERLSELRQEAGLTQSALAQRLGINKHSISSYERNISEPPDEIKIQIACFFDVSIDYLLGLTKNPTTRSELSDYYIRLPSSFPNELIDEVKDYSTFLLQRYQRKTRLNNKQIDTKR